MYQLLDLYFPNGSLLPNLQRLTCFINWEYFVWIKLFFSPSLFFIDLNTLGNNPDPIAGPVLGLLPMDTLQMLRLEGVILDADSMKMLSDRLFNLSTPLQELITYHKISNEAAIHISKLSNLRTLGISFRKSNFTLPEATDVFPSLDCLYAEVDDNLDWLDLLKGMRAGLKYLSITWAMDLVPPQHFMQRLVSAPYASGAQDTLRALHINAERRWIISRKTMAPLLSLRNLTTLSIRTRCHPHPCPFHLSDADIAQLASSLRKLEVLILGGSRCTNPPPRFTMDSLFSLSAYCTSLLRLKVHFNAPKVEYSTAQPLQQTKGESG